MMKVLAAGSPAKFSIMKNTLQGLTQKMIKFPGSNVMHIDPSPELAEQYQDALKNLKIKEKVQGNNSIDNEIINRNDDLCGICYRVPIGAVFTPCMHCEICARCAFRSTRFNGLCPFCRSVNEILIF